MRDPVVFNANKSRTSLTSQYTANRNRLAHADRLSQAYVQQNIKESQRTFKKIPPRRKSAETEQGQEKIRRASNAYGGEDEHDSFASRHDLR